MSDIIHYFPIKASLQKVFEMISTPSGLDIWWTKSSSGECEENGQYELGFGPGYDWKAHVSMFIPSKAFELEITDSDPDWLGSRVGFRLDVKNEMTWVEFYHNGWPESNEHYRISCYCWAMYLRILKRNLEHGETVAYEKRLDV